MGHLTVAVSENSFKTLFAIVRDGFSIPVNAPLSGSEAVGPITFIYEIAFHLEGGTVDLLDTNSLKISGLEIKWDKLMLTLQLEIEEWCWGGYWVPAFPFWTYIPPVCFFSDNPDINTPIDLGGFITSKISLQATPVVAHRIDPQRTPAMSDLDAEDAGIPNKWQIFIDPDITIDLFDVADVVNSLIEQILNDQISKLLDVIPGVPDFAKDLLKSLISPVIDFISDIIAFPLKINEWLSDLLGFDLGLFDTIAEAIAEGFFSDPIHEFEDPYPILPPESGLIPVKIPIKDLSVTINEDEMIIDANVGS